MNKYFLVKLDQVLENLNLTEIPKPTDRRTYYIHKFDGYALERTTYTLAEGWTTDWYFISSKLGDHIWLSAEIRDGIFSLWLRSSSRLKYIKLGEIELPKNY